MFLSFFVFALAARRLVGGVRNGFTMFEQLGRLHGIVKYDFSVCTSILFHLYSVTIPYYSEAGLVAHGGL